MLTAGYAAAVQARGDGLRVIRPIDDDPLDPALQDLIRRMRHLTERKDFRALMALMLPDFRVEFDEGKGPQAFRRYWRPDGAGSALWTVLQRVLSFWGTFFSETLFAIPYVYAQFPSDVDLLGHVVALKENVPLLDKPEGGGTPIGTLNYSIVPVAEPFSAPVVIPADRFVELSHPAVGRCFVAGADVYSPAAHRLFFERVRGQWRWISLAAGTLADSPDMWRPTRRG